MKWVEKFTAFYSTDSGKVSVFAAIAIIVVLFVAANANAGNQDHTCQGGHNCNGGQGGHTQTNTQTQTTDIRSDSHSSAYSGSRGNIVSVDNRGNPASSESTGGAAESNSVISIDAGDNYERNAPTAPSTYADHCSQGASASSIGGSGGIVSRDPLCDHLKVADAMYSAWQKMKIECDAVPQTQACDYNKEKKYYLSYLENMDAMDRIMAQTTITGQVSKTAGHLALPMAMLWVLFLL